VTGTGTLRGGEKDNVEGAIPTEPILDGSCVATGPKIGRTDAVDDRALVSCVIMAGIVMGSITRCMTPRTGETGLYRMGDVALCITGVT